VTARGARAAASLRLRAADLRDALSSNGRDPLVPPRRLAGYVGDSDFRSTGEEFLGHFIALGGLTHTDRVLEIGCGIGRMARPLVSVLRPPGSYDGFDVVAAGIDWCRQRYVGTPAPFRFVHADLRNAAYNRDGRAAAEEYRFPWEDGSFDFVLATSLFTHVLEATADRYLAEAARVLAPGGRLLTTWLLLGGGAPTSLHRLDGRPVAVADPAVPEDAVAYDPAWVLERLAAHGLDDPAIHRGLSAQDIIVVER